MPKEAYRSNAIFKYVIYALFSERCRGRVVETQEKIMECCKIFGFDSASRQFNFDPLS